MISIEEFGQVRDALHEYQMVIEDIIEKMDSITCGDCLGFRVDFDKPCPNKDCMGRLYETGICPGCGTPEPSNGDICPECNFNWSMACW
jgi:hypothetical protein